MKIVVTRMSTEELVQVSRNEMLRAFFCRLDMQWIKSMFVYYLESPLYTKRILYKIRLKLT